MEKPVIICVDDEQFILNSLNKQLQRKFGESYEYEFAESAEEALELIEELVEDGYRVVMIISDMIMPGMSGDEFLVDVHRNHPKPIKVLLTGQAALESAINAINHADLFRFLVKPWDEDDFLLTVEKGLKQYTLVETLEKQVEMFRKFVPEQFLECLSCEDFGDISPKQAKQMSLSILFSDIRQFTALSEVMTPEEDFKFLNSYFSYMSGQIKKHGGFIDKFIGDGIMALFPNSASDAVKAAIAMLHRLKEYNGYRANKGYRPLEIGIGVNTGDVVLGIVGAEDRVDSTVVGDAVNLASRIEGLTKIYGTPLLISEHTYFGLSDQIEYDIRFVDRVRVKGKSQPVVIYEVFDADPPQVRELKLTTKKVFEEAWHAFHEKEFKEAERVFQECLRQNPGDKVAQTYVERCQHILNPEKTPIGWE